MHYGILSKMDEVSQSKRLGNILPSHEYFHQSMVVADCSSQLFRESSRGLPGGVHFIATMLNRKEAKTGRGKDCIDELKDFILLKSETTFCHFFLKKFNLDPSYDNTPALLKSANWRKKQAYVHSMVEEALRDLLPFFKECSIEEPNLEDHPLQDGRRSKRDQNKSSEGTDVDQPQSSFDRVSAGEYHNSKKSIPASRSSSCSLNCSFTSQSRIAMLKHMNICTQYSSAKEQTTELKEQSEKEDMFWNYKTNEFFIDSIFAVSTVFEKFGDGLGCYILNKILLPIFYGLKHHNYANSIHRCVFSEVMVRIG